jgi:hypothetical protein
MPPLSLDFAKSIKAVADHDKLRKRHSRADDDLPGQRLSQFMDFGDVKSSPAIPA